MAYVLVLDVSMGKVTKCLDDLCLFEGEILHTKSGFSTLLQEILALPETPSIVFESTGVYSKVIETFCQNNHFSYCLLNPLEAKKQLDQGLRVLKLINKMPIVLRNLTGNMNGKTRDISQPFMKNPMI
ncbi:transposase [Enterococcus ratti]|uniref:IS110 family transposase n=1 Tax=Enterococcus ratti TaxID=150033 RepID=UPI00351626EE